MTRVFSRELLEQKLDWNGFKKKIGESRLAMEIINNFFEELCFKEQKNRIVARGGFRSREIGFGLKFQCVLILFEMIQ